MEITIDKHWHDRRSGNLSKRSLDHRSPFQRDRARILHSAAFRRLQAKTQVMGVGLSDFYRTRLTHSLEAAQIGAGISAQLKAKNESLTKGLIPDEDSLIESICLAHDIGHPPFGHGGEIALNYMMRNHGGFEGNGQTFRIVAKLEPYSEHYGMNLTKRTLLGLLKYPNTLDELKNSQLIASDVQQFRQLKAGDWHPPKGIYSHDDDILSWVLGSLSSSDRTLFQSAERPAKKHGKTQFKSLDCSMMELADDIAYGVHDLEDAIVTGIVQESDFRREVTEKILLLTCPFLSEKIEQFTQQLFSEKHYLQKDSIGALVNYLITAIELVDLKEQGIAEFEEPLLRFNAKLPDLPAKVLQIFKDFVYQYVIKLPQIQRLEFKGQQVVMELFDAFASDPERLLPKNTVARWQLAQSTPASCCYRVIADYISGMTDEFAQRMYNELFGKSV